MAFILSAMLSESLGQLTLAIALATEVGAIEGLLAEACRHGLFMPSQSAVIKTCIII
jgi:hypothetical protein